MVILLSTRGTAGSDIWFMCLADKPMVPYKACCLSIFEGESLKPGQVFSSTFIGITFERNEIFSWCKFHNKEEIKGFNMIYTNTV